MVKLLGQPQWIVPRRRLSVALLFEPDVVLELNAIRSAVGSPSLGQIPPHITLISPINVPASELQAVVDLVGQSAAGVRSFRARIGPVETFSPVTPVLYMGVACPDREIHRLHERLLNGPLQRTPTHPFVPHVTIHESMDEALLAAALLVLKSFSRVVSFTGIDLLEQESDQVWRTHTHAPFRRDRVDR